MVLTVNSTIPTLNRTDRRKQYRKTVNCTVLTLNTTVPTVNSSVLTVSVLYRL
jgi:hypothetical protein